MKLSAQYTKVNFLIAISVLVLTGVVYYVTINYLANNELDHNLVGEIDEIHEYFETFHRLPKPDDFEQDQITFTPTDKKVIKPAYFNAAYQNPRTGKPEAGRAVVTSIALKGKNYRMMITVSKESTENLVQVILLITLGLTAFLLAVLAVANRYVLDGLWRPFYQILANLRGFNVTEERTPLVAGIKVDEFNELNDAVATMSSRVKHDYQNLKTFTENASHEMMTPIAVITSKLDTLIQDESLRPDQYGQITDIYTAAGRLSKLNQSLLLLVKIENDLLKDVATMNLQDIIAEKVQQFNELVQNKNITLVQRLNDTEITASKYLLEMLINNLFTNAIRHNIPYGMIRIELKNKRLLFQNSGEKSALNPQEIFERFQKGKASDGTGLGLTIALNICKQYNWQLAYYFEDPLHTFQVDF
jgi:signal transduction histidine kinase